MDSVWYAAIFLLRVAALTLLAEDGEHSDKHPVVGAQPDGFHVLDAIVDPLGAEHDDPEVEAHQLLNVARLKPVHSERGDHAVDDAVEVYAGDEGGERTSATTQASKPRTVRGVAKSSTRWL